MNLGNTSYDIKKWDYATRAAAKAKIDETAVFYYVTSHWKSDGE